MDEKFQVRVPLQAKLSDRFQLARFARLDRREHNRIMYQVTQESVSRAGQNGGTAEQILAFLTRITNNQLPLKVMESIRAWESRFGGAKLEQATLLRLKNRPCWPKFIATRNCARCWASRLAPPLFSSPPKTPPECASFSWNWLLILRARFLNQCSVQTTFQKADFSAFLTSKPAFRR
jgi:hypothetical protein